MSEESSTKSLFDKSRRPFLMRKVHSLTGVLPVGGFLCFHLFENAKALQGQQQFDEAVAGISHMPYLLALELTILVPLLFHASYGVWLALQAKYNNARYTYSRNWMYTLQRATGLIAFAFIVVHLGEYWWPRFSGNVAPDQFYPMLCANLSSTVGPVPVRALWYVIGIASCAFHFANGLWGFLFSWGVTVSRRSQRMAAWATMALGIVVLCLGANTVIYFAKGAGLWDLIRGERTAPSGARTCADVAFSKAQASAAQ